MKKIMNLIDRTNYAPKNRTIAAAPNVVQRNSPIGVGDCVLVRVPVHRCTLIAQVVDIIGDVYHVQLLDKRRIEVSKAQIEKKINASFS